MSGVGAPSMNLDGTGLRVVVVAALNGLAVIQAYFRIFTGRPHVSTIDLQIRPAERAAVLIISALILAGGIYPQPGVSNRYRAALKLAAMRDGGASAHPPRRDLGPTADAGAEAPRGRR
ncbi:MAG: hypothetical protein J0I40_01275 [Cellulomonas sp.]|nr:hypothetical protein [Cellulomonas sp.]